MSADELPAGLADVVARLVDRHLTSAKDWYPHEFAAAADRHVAIPDSAASALFVNLLTEDGLPYYTAELEARLGRDGPWGEWSRRWTAEEQRHGIALREWVHATGVLDPYELERARLATMTTGFPWHGDTLPGALVYVAVQELATRVAHRRTGDFLAGTSGYEMLRRVSADENRHHLLYRDVVAHLLAVEPSATLVAIDATVRSFRMPGTAIPGFREHALRVAAAGIYTWSVHADQVLTPVFRSWRIDDLDRLTPEAEEARRSLHRHVERLRRVGRRADLTRSASP